MSDAPIQFQAVISQVRTMADGGLRFVFDAGEDAIVQAAQLMECKKLGIVLLVKVTGDKPVKQVWNRKKSDDTG